MSEKASKAQGTARVATTGGDPQEVVVGDQGKLVSEVLSGMGISSAKDLVVHLNGRPAGPNDIVRVDDSLVIAQNIRGGQ